MRCMCCTWAVFFAAMQGCRAPTATLTNPFLAPDRVPAPATRTLIEGAAQPYYSGDLVPKSPTAVPPTAVPAYGPPGAPSVVPPGGGNTTPQPYPGATLQNNNAAHGLRPTSAESPLGPLTTVGEGAIRVHTDDQNLRFSQAPPDYLGAANGSLQQFSPVPPNPGLAQVQPEASFTSSGSPLPDYAAQQINYQVPISDPRAVRLRARPPGQLSIGDHSSAPIARDGFRPQGSSRNRSVRRAISPSQSLGGPAGIKEAFGYDPSYRWLRGRLEYSEATEQWKLRYIPIQGTPDQFGGSVLIANPRVLSGLRRDEHVLLRGQLHPRGNGGQSFSPIYTVLVVQRQ